MGWLGGQKSKHPNLGLCKISTKCNDNLKTTLRWCWKMNVHAHSLKCSIEDDLFFYLIIAQIKGCKSKQLEAKKSRWTHLRWTWNGSGLELLALINHNKNGWSSYKNFNAIIGAISPQFFKYVVGVITFIETKHIPPLEMGREACEWITGTFGHSKEPSLMSIPNTQMKIESKEVNWC
jgi:hypothetical protein